jgi:hypothetical protein
VIAGALAFRLFVYVLPMYLLMLIAGAAAFSIDPAGSNDVASGSGLSSHLVATLADATETSRRSLWILVPLTLWAVVVAGPSVHRVVALANSNAWRRPRCSTKPSAALGVLVFALAVTGAAGAVRYARTEGFVVVATVLAVALFGALWLGASMRLPRDPDTGWIGLLPGAALVAVGTQGLYLFNVLYLQRKVESASEACGALGLAATGLLWLYLAGRILVAAPVVNAVVHGWRLGRVRGDEGGVPDLST